MFRDLQPFAIYGFETRPMGMVSFLGTLALEPADIAPDSEEFVLFRQRVDTMIRALFGWRTL